MKKLLALMLVLLTAFAVGCITDSGGDDDDDNDNGGGGGGTTGGDIQATTYMPLKVGVVWNQSETGTQWGEEFSDTYSTSVTGTETINGAQWYVITEDGEDSYARIADNILYTMDEVFVAKNAVSPAAKAAAAAQAEYEIWPWINFGKGVGGTWTIMTDSDSGEGYTMSATWTGKRLSNASVTVPAGTFQNCAVFELVMTSNYSSTYNGQTHSSVYKSTTTIWFAPNVGFVKQTDVATETWTGSPTETMENLTTVLTSYTIPQDAAR